MTVIGPFFGFPGIVNYGAGELQVFCTEASGHAGGERGMPSWRSLDGGLTWTFDATVTSSTTARDPCGFVTSAGTTLVTCFAPAGAEGSFVYRSTDKGATWSSRIGLHGYDDPDTYSACSGPVVQLAGGKLLASVYTRPAAGGDWSSVVVSSTDDGLTWSDPVLVAEGAGGRSFQEPNLLLLGNGDIVCFHRSTLGVVFRSVSSDGGATWSAPQSVIGGLQGRPNAVLTSDGTVILMNRPTDYARRGVYCASSDNGVTWGTLGVLTKGAGTVTPGPAGWFVYAQGVETAPNDIAVAFSVETGPGAPDNIASEAWLFFTRITKA
jgi:hypothetical protein